MVTEFLPHRCYSYNGYANEFIMVRYIKTKEATHWLVNVHLFTHDGKSQPVFTHNQTLKIDVDQFKYWSPYKVSKTGLS